MDAIGHDQKWVVVIRDRIDPADRGQNASVVLLLRRGRAEEVVTPLEARLPDPAIPFEGDKLASAVGRTTGTDLDVDRDIGVPDQHLMLEHRVDDADRIIPEAVAGHDHVVFRDHFR